MRAHCMHNESWIVFWLGVVSIPGGCYMKYSLWKPIFSKATSFTNKNIKLRVKKYFDRKRPFLYQIHIYVYGRGIRMYHSRIKVFWKRTNNFKTLPHVLFPSTDLLRNNIYICLLTKMIGTILVHNCTKFRIQTKVKKNQRVTEIRNY